MSQFTKNLELESVVNSGLTDPAQRDYSTHFDQRRTVNASGVVLVTSASREYAADGYFGLADYYELTVNATGVLRVNIRDQNSCGNVLILNNSGQVVMTAPPSKFSSRQNATTTTNISSSGSYYAYIQIKGRSGAEYRVGIDVTAT